MVDKDPYPGAPGQSGSIDNMTKLLGVGAYTIDDPTEGSGLRYGQDVGSDTFVKSLIYSVAMGMGTGDGTIESAMNNLGTYLQTMPLDTLKLLQPFVPNTTPSDFDSVDEATNKILAMFQVGSGALNIDDFNNWVESIFDPNGQLWEQVRSDWNAFLDEIGLSPEDIAAAITASQQKWNDLLALISSYPAAGSSAATVAVWWSNLLLAIGVPNPLAATVANIISGNYDWAKLSKQFWDQVFTSLGWTNGTQVASQIYSNGVTANSAQTQANTQAAWWARLPENLLISIDGMHYFYPLGSPSDGPTTTSNAYGTPRRTWYAMKADMALMQGQTNGTSTPTIAIPQDVGTFATNVQTQVLTNESTLAQVQADVDALKTSDNSVAGAKFLVSASGGSASSWGTPWTTSVTNSNIAPDSQNDLYAVTTASSSAVDLTVKGIFNAGTTLSDDQIVSVVFQEAATNMAGGLGPRNKVKARMSADGQNYIWAEVNYNRVQLGYCVSGIETVWKTVNSVSVPAGALLELFCGSSAGHRNYQVKVGGKVITTHPEVGTSSMMGTSYREGGQDMTASRGIANDVFKPARVKQFKLQDSNAAASTYGTSARWYRSSTSWAGFTRGNVLSLGSGVYDTQEYASPDIEMVVNGFKLYTPGRYRLTHACKVSNSGSSWTSVSTGTFYASVNRITLPGPTVVSYASSKYDLNPTLGVGGSISFNAVGDGGATELWAPSIAIGGSGTAYVGGDGGGEATWAVIERID